MRRHSPAHDQVKIAGNRDLDALLKVREIGGTRYGATRTASMLDEARLRLGMAATGLPGVGSWTDAMEATAT